MECIALLALDIGKIKGKLLEVSERILYIAPYAVGQLPF